MLRQSVYTQMRSVFICRGTEGRHTVPAVASLSLGVAHTRSSGEFSYAVGHAKYLARLGDDNRCRYGHVYMALWAAYDKPFLRSHLMDVSAALNDFAGFRFVYHEGGATLLLCDVLQTPVCIRGRRIHVKAPIHAL